MKIEKYKTITTIHGDCMEFLREQPDKSFDLAIVDPPYGIGIASNAPRQRFAPKDWDNGIPTQEYFNELFRVAKHSIIWGGNYFALPPTQCFVFWKKDNPVPNFADGELAWTDFERPALCFDFRYYGVLVGKPGSEKLTKIHPTEKPVQLYQWLIKQFAKKGDRLLDTFGGSMSSAIAAHRMGFEMTIIEKDAEYYNKAVKRLVEQQRQQELFKNFEE